MITFYEKKTIIDFSSTENYISHKMEKLSETEEIKNYFMTRRVTTLREHQLEVKDSLVDPFDFFSN